MAGSVNKVILIGNLGKDPEVRTLSNGTTVTTIPIATSESYRDKTSGELREITDWHNVVCWRGLATICEKYIGKGSRIYVAGKVKYRKYQDKNGVEKYITEIVAEEMRNLSARTNPNPHAEAPAPEEPAEKSKGGEEDDLPF